MVRWFAHLGHTYGASLMFLVGLGYLIQGFRCFPWFTITFYLKDVLLVDLGILQIILNTVNLPMVAKPIYGIISDSVYIRGAHRIPYIVIGGLLQMLSWGIIAFTPSVGSSITLVFALLTLSNLGASIVDVANDALVAECSKKRGSTGELQSFAWFSVAIGGVSGNLAAVFALGRLEFRTIFGMFGVLLVCQVCRSMSIDEGSFGLNWIMLSIGDAEKGEELLAPEHPHAGSKRRHSASEAFPSTLTQDVTQEGGTGEHPEHIAVKSPESAPKGGGTTKQPFADLIYLMRQPEILYALAWYLASYAMIPTLASTMFYFQTEHLRIDPSTVGLAKVVGQIGLMGGSAAYSYYSRAGMLPLRKLLVIIQVLLFLLMMSDILLVKRVNVKMGIPDAVFVVTGASAFVDAVNQFKVLPFIVFLARLCPAGHEASVLAAFMSMQCLATIVSGYMGVTLASFLSISSNDFSELPTAIFIQSVAALLPLLWISLIPDDDSTVKGLQHRDDSYLPIDDGLEENPT